MSTDALKPTVRLIIVDDKVNYQKRISDGYFFPGSVFLTHTPVSGPEELVEYLTSLNPMDDIIIYLHAFRERPDWVPKLRATMEAIKNLTSQNINLKIVTSDKTFIVKEEFPQEDVDDYNTIVKKANSKNYQTQKVAIALGRSLPHEEKATGYFFLSHSSRDEKIVNLFIEKILVLGLGVAIENIFCTSRYDTSVVAGSDIPDELKEALTKTTMFIQFISDSYMQSGVCLNEMGAGWYKLDKKNILTLIIPPMSYDQVGFLNVQNFGIKLNDKAYLAKVYDDFRSHFSPTVKYGAFQNQVEQFLNELAAIVS